MIAEASHRLDVAFRVLAISFLLRHDYTSDRLRWLEERGAIRVET